MNLFTYKKGVKIALAMIMIHFSINCFSQTKRLKYHKSNTASEFSHISITKDSITLNHEHTFLYKGPNQFLCKRSYTINQWKENQLNFNADQINIVIFMPGGSCFSFFHHYIRMVKKDGKLLVTTKIISNQRKEPIYCFKELSLIEWEILLESIREIRLAAPEPTPAHIDDVYLPQKYPILLQTDHTISGFVQEFGYPDGIVDQVLELLDLAECFKRNW